MGVGKQSVETSRERDAMVLRIYDETNYEGTTAAVRQALTSRRVVLLARSPSNVRTAAPMLRKYTQNELHVNNCGILRSRNRLSVRKYAL